MPTLIDKPHRIEAATNKTILIDEYIGKLRTGHDQVSIAFLQCPPGWIEPGQTPTFEEYTLVLKGTVLITHRDGTLKVHAGQTVITHPGEWVQYSTPETEGAEFVAVCIPAFSMDAAYRDP